MSEYQRVAFRAIDGPVSKENLAHMERQSSRTDPHSTVRSEILAEFNKGQRAAVWSTVLRDRTISELRGAGFLAK
jgi:hypothetical protein